MTTINFAAYIPLALRTEAPLPTPLDRLNHALLGLLSETGESTTEIKRIAIYGKSLDDAAKGGGTLRSHIAEEIGDTLWYIAIAADVLGFVPEGKAPWDQLVAYPSAEAGRNLVRPAFEVAGAVGLIAETLLEAGDGDLSVPQKVEVRYALENVLSGLATLSHVIGIPLQQIADENIAKLTLRYPDKFSAEAAEARADKGGLDARNS